MAFYLKNIQLKLNNSAIKKYVLLFILLLSAESCKIFKHKISEKRLDDTNTRMISIARTYTGVPYLTGGTSYGGVDCSGLLWSVFKELGFNIPRVAREQAEFFQVVTLENVQPGDLVFFVTTNKGTSSTISHSGIITEADAVKGVRFIHASSSRGVREDNLSDAYWRSSFAKAIRPFFAK